MALSALLNLVALALAGYFWPPLPAAPPPVPKLLLLTLLPPAPRIKPPPRPKPPLKPPALKRQPRVMATPLPPAPHHYKIAPASPGGGAPKPRPKPKPKRAIKLHPLKRVVPKDADIPDSGMHDDDQDDGMTDADEDGQANTTDKGKANTTMPGASAATTPGSGQAGTGPGSGKGSGPESGGLGPFGITGKGGGGTGPRHVVYVLDISGSMAMTEAKFNGEKRIDKAREELKAQIQSLSDGELFSIIVFSNEVRSFRQELVFPTKDTVQEAFQFLDKQEPHDATDLERALNMALMMPDVNLIYVITDGVPWPPDGDKYGPKDFPALAERIRKANVNHIPIYTIGLLGPNPYDDGDDSLEASALLTQLAHDSDGQFKDVKLDGEKP